MFLTKAHKVLTSASLKALGIVLTRDENIHTRVGVRSVATI